MTILIGCLASLLALAACGGGGATQPTAVPPAPARTASPAAVSPAGAASPAGVASPAGAPSPAGIGASVPISGPFQGESRTLNGAGATFPAALYSKWFTEYERVTGVRVNYQAIGSGGGIKGIQDGTVDFGGSDSPMTDEQLQAAKGEVFHVPMALGAVVATYNVPEAATTPIKFTPETLAGVYLGDIVKWNDPKLVADNPSLARVDRDIVVVHRSDGSGTTSIWVDYLSTVNPTWLQRVGRGTSVNWPTGIGGRGNEGVAGEVKQNPYTIGYVELIYALQNKLGVGLVKNKAGSFVEPTLAAVTAAAQASAANIAPDLRVSIVDAAGADAYPISGFTWLLAYKHQTDGPKATALTSLMWWAIHEGQRYNADLGYAKLPAPIVARAEQQIREISVSGQPAFPGR